MRIKRANFAEVRRKQRLHLFHEGFLWFLTTSAMSSMPFLEVANSLLGRMESKTVWRGRLESGASMSPMVAEERRFNETAERAEEKKVTVSRPNKAKAKKKNDVGA